MAEPSLERPGVRIARHTPTLPSLTRSVWERMVRVRPTIVVLGAVLVVAAGQLAEDLADSEPLQLLMPTEAVRRWTLIVAVLYMLAISHVIDRYVRRSLHALDEAVKVDSEKLRQYAGRMRRPGALVDVALLVLSGIIVALLFSALGTSLPIDDPVTNSPRHLTGVTASDLLILAEYTLIGWAMLSLVFCTISRARALGQLSREPLEVDVFDTTNLLPLGNIALATALAPAGIVVILLVGFGRPSAPVSWTLLVLVTLASLVALILPLRGIHRQMAAAKERTLGVLNTHLREVYERVNVANVADITEMTGLNHRTTTLLNLRKAVGEMTTWPFTDTLAFSRAVLFAMAPLIYTVMNELIKLFWIVPLSR